MVLLTFLEQHLYSYCVICNAKLKYYCKLSYNIFALIEKQQLTNHFALLYLKQQLKLHDYLKFESFCPHKAYFFIFKLYVIAWFFPLICNHEELQHI